MKSAAVIATIIIVFCVFNLLVADLFEGYMIAKFIFSGACSILLTLSTFGAVDAMIPDNKNK